MSDVLNSLGIGIATINETRITQSLGPYPTTNLAEVAKLLPAAESLEALLKSLGHQ